MNKKWNKGIRKAGRKEERNENRWRKKGKVVKIKTKHKNKHNTHNNLTNRTHYPIIQLPRGGKSCMVTPSWSGMYKPMGKPRTGPAQPSSWIKGVRGACGDSIKAQRAPTLGHTGKSRKAGTACDSPAKTGAEQSGSGKVTRVSNMCWKERW